MSTPTTEELRQLSERAQNFPPETARRMPSGFLSLAPTTSASYPQVPKGHEQQQLEPLVIAAPKLEGDANPEPTKRRTSSISSDGAKSPTGFRFLKLGPVHWGEHPGDHKGDWHEVAVE